MNPVQAADSHKQFLCTSSFVLVQVAFEFIKTLWLPRRSSCVLATWAFDLNVSVVRTRAYSWYYCVQSTDRQTPRMTFLDAMLTNLFFEFDANLVSCLMAKPWNNVGHAFAFRRLCHWIIPLCSYFISTNDGRILIPDYPCGLPSGCNVYCFNRRAQGFCMLHHDLTQ